MIAGALSPFYWFVGARLHFWFAGAPRARWRQRLWALSLAAALEGCGFPSPEACALACGEQDTCPDGFECQAETRLCVPHGTVAACEQVVHRPERPNPDSAGGGGPDGMGGQGGAGSGGDAAAAGSPSVGAAGNMGAAGGAAPTGGLAIEDLSPTASSCTGTALNRSLGASGGVAPYRWRMLRAPAGVELAGSDSDTLLVTGISGEPGVLEIELEDGVGAVARSSAIVVHESPRIENPPLPPICSGEPYEVRLLAEGGQPEGYVWSAQLAEASPSGGLEELGLAISGSTLAGVLAAEDEAFAPFELALELSDGRCRSSATFALDVVPVESDECPSIRVEDGGPFDALPSPCRGSGYGEALTVLGGEPPYSWSASALPPGLFFDSELATLEGIAEGDGDLAVELIDATQRTVRKTYGVRTRDKCWLAYVAAQPGPPRLELVDGRLLARERAEARRTAPVTPSDEGVFDFAFSPDGRFIAYRLGPDASASRLELFRVADGAVQALALGGSVSAYAWSPDSATLAVVLGSGAETLLGGVDVLAVARAPVAPGTEFGGLRPLATRAIPNVDSELTWFDAAGLAYLSRDVAGLRRRLVTLGREGEGFAPPALRAAPDFSDTAGVIAAVSGVIVAEPETDALVFFAGGGGAPITHSADLVLSPSGSFAGAARGGALQIFRPSASSASGGTPFLSVGGCTALLAWASDRERVACADERDGRNQVVSFDIPRAASQSIGPLSPMPEPYLFPLGQHVGRRRLWSPSGRWLAFATDADLYVSDNADGASRLAATVPAARIGTRPGALAYSPDEAFLLVGAGNAVALLDLEGDRSSPLVLSNSANISDDCSERFVAGATGWCGREPRAAELAWSSGSDLVSFRSSLGTLLVADVSLASSGVIGDLLEPDGDCFEACRSSESARFQP
jgi:hypothetical protein